MIKLAYDKIKKQDRSVDWKLIVKYREALLFQDLFCQGMGNKDYYKTCANMDFALKNRKSANTYIYQSEKEMNALKECISKKCKENPEYLRWLCNQAVTIPNKLIEYSASIRNRNLEYASKADLQPLFEEYFEKVRQGIPFFYIMINACEYAEGLLKQKLELEYKINFEEFSARLVQTLKKTNVDKEKEALLKMGQFIQENKIVDFKCHDKVNLMVQDHINKFGWLNTSYYLGDPWSESEVFDKLERVLQVDCSKELNSITQNNEIANSDFENETKGFSDELKNIIMLTSELIFTRNEKTDAFYIADTNILNLKKRFSKLTGIPLLYVTSLCSDEIISILNKGSMVSLSELKSRFDDYVSICLSNKTYLILDYVEDKGNYTQINQMTGLIANKGIAKGIVKIIKGSNELSKIDNGDILVTGITTADYIPAMLKAAAYVTDIGGISCHTAILAREMKKPCIIGTMIATKVLKDGDFVEVNADKGVVNILKKASK